MKRKIPNLWDDDYYDLQTRVVSNFRNTDYRVNVNKMLVHAPRGSAMSLTQGLLQLGVVASYAWSQLLKRLCPCFQVPSKKFPLSMVTPIPQSFLSLHIKFCLPIPNPLNIWVNSNVKISTFFFFNEKKLVHILLDTIV